jgi:anti-sigma factor RsiW
MSHPSELKLERHLLDPERSPIKEHLAGCEHCRARVLEMEKQGEDFRRFVYPATLEGVSRRRWALPRALWVLAPAAGLATVLLIARTGPTSDYIGAKGDALTMTAYASLPSGAKVLADGETVPASASIRFRIRAKERCALSLLSVDAAGQVSKLYAQEVRGDVALPGGVRLDGKPGPERFFAVCAPGGYDAVEQAARRLGEEIRQKRELPGVHGPQASLLIEKKN